MTRSLPLLSCLALPAALVACRTDSAAPVVPDEVESLNAVAAARVDTTPRAIISWSSQVDTSADGSGAYVAAGIIGDGRDERGSATAVGTGAFRGSYCGVAASIGGAAGDLNLDADTYYTSTMAVACGSARRFAFFINGADQAPFWSAPHAIFRGLYTLGVGESDVQWQGFGVGLRSDCTGLRYDDLYAPNSSSLLQKRLVDTTITNAAGQVAPARRWVVRSRAPHRAMCIYKDKRGNVIPTGVTYFLPLEVTIVELRYPYGTYP